MSRYFVVVEGAAVAEQYVVAEVVRDRVDDGTSRSSSLAADIAGEAATICTLDEMQATPGGRSALRRWIARDDAAFDLDNAFLSGDYDLDKIRSETAKRRTVLDASTRDFVTQSRMLVERAAGLLAENRRRVAELRVNLGHMQSIKEALIPVREATPRGRRQNRHLRSVS